MWYPNSVTTAQLAKATWTECQPDVGILWNCLQPCFSVNDLLCTSLNTPAKLFADAPLNAPKDLRKLNALSLKRGGTKQFGIALSAVDNFSSSSLAFHSSPNIIRLALVLQTLRKSGMSILNTFAGSIVFVIDFLMCRKIWLVKVKMDV